MHACFVSLKKGWGRWVTLSECNSTLYACYWRSDIQSKHDTFDRLGVYNIRVRVTNNLGVATRKLPAVKPFNIGIVWLV